jgi:aminotransferase
MKNKNTSLQDKLSQKALKISPSGIRKFFDIVSQMPDCVSLGVGEPDFVTPWRIIESGVFSLEKGKTHYTSNFGLLELREKISGYLEKNFQVSYNPKNEIIVTIGVSEALDLTLRAIINPGDEIIVAEPAYVSYSPNIEILYGKPVWVKTGKKDEFKLKAENVEKAITAKTKAVLLNSPNNPTGAVIEKEELIKIAELSKKHGFFVIADEIYSELIYESDPYSIASFKGMKENVIFLNGFSKTFAMTGWRIGYVCAHHEVIEIMMKIHQYTTLCAPIMGQHAAIEALGNGKNDKNQMRDEYLRRRNLIVSRFNDMGLPCFNPGGAFYVFPDISPTGMDPEKFAETLLFEKKVAVVPGNVFCSEKVSHIRCCYATSIENIKIALERIESFLNEIQSNKGK